MAGYSHFTDEGRPTLVDVSQKDTTLRTAFAEGWIDVPASIYETVSKGAVKKGNPFPLAELAGIMGAKKTSDIIPLCHNIRIDNVRVECGLDEESKSVHITSEVTAKEVTGVEMEALTAVSAAALCFYDMCKAIDKGMVIKNIRLLKKTGGKSGVWTAERGYEK